MKINLYTYFFKKAYLPFWVGMLFILASCQRHSDMQDEGADFFQGVWVQDSVPHQEDLLSYNLHEFKITCDSLYANIKVHNKNQTIPDSCYGDGNWKEYAKAVYVVRGDSIIVEGVYTKENGKQKISGCHKTGPYVPRFKIAKVTKDSIVLENRFGTQPIKLRKVSDITCVPKKRWEL